MGSCPGIFVLQTKVLGGAGLCQPRFKGLSPSRPPGAGEEREGEKMRDPGNEVGSVRLFYDQNKTRATKLHLNSPAD